MENSTSNPNAWTFFADNDLKAAENLIEDNEPEVTGTVTFLCQQAIEKYFKAFLTKNKVSFVRTHDLLKLYSQVKEIKDFNINPELFNDLVGLYIESRYPTDVAFLSDGILPTIEKAQIYLDFAKKVAGIVKAEL